MTAAVAERESETERDREKRPGICENACAICDEREYQPPNDRLDITCGCIGV